MVPEVSGLCWTSLLRAFIQKVIRAMSHLWKYCGECSVSDEVSVEDDLRARAGTEGYAAACLVCSTFSPFFLVFALPAMIALSSASHTVSARCFCGQYCHRS
jgi:hypothetical protein